MMKFSSQSDKRSVNTLTQKISLYFATIAIVVAALLFIFSQSVLSWLEDELNRRVLEKVLIRSYRNLLKEKNHL